jgi:hypothetical protein
VKWLALTLAAFMGCGYSPQLKPSRYDNDLKGPLDFAQDYFEQTYGYVAKRRATSYVTFHFEESQELVNEICQSPINVTGCICSYWTFVILDHPDPAIRCQTIMHEAGHMFLAKISLGEDWDYAHKDPFFTHLFTANCEVK